MEKRDRRDKKATANAVHAPIRSCPFNMSPNMSSYREEVHRCCHSCQISLSLSLFLFLFPSSSPLSSIALSSPCRDRPFRQSISSIAFVSFVSFWGYFLAHSCLPPIFSICSICSMCSSQLDRQAVKGPSFLFLMFLFLFPFLFVSSFLSLFLLLIDSPFFNWDPRFNLLISSDHLSTSSSPGRPARSVFLGDFRGR